MFLALLLKINEVFSAGGRGSVSVTDISPVSSLLPFTVPHTV